MNENSADRACTWDDIADLHALGATARRVDPGASGTHIGELYWALRGTPNPLANMRVWPARDGTLSAAAWLDPPGSSDFVIDPAYPSRMEEALVWLEAASHHDGASALSIVVGDGDNRRLAALTRRGYARTSTGNVRHARDLDGDIMPQVLPNGFLLRHVASNDEITARAAVESAAFGGEVTAGLWRLLTTRLTRYDATLDLIVLAPDGRGASACTCWYDQATRTGEVEAVGTAPAFRRMGLCRAVILEGLRRLQARGATRVELYTNIGNVASAALYASCGFAVAGEDYAWTKQLS